MENGQFEALDEYLKQVYNRTPVVIKKPSEDKLEEIEMPTPFANVVIKIAGKDLWAKEEIEKWIFSRCGIPTKDEIMMAKSMQCNNVVTT